MTNMITHDRSTVGFWRVTQGDTVLGQVATNCPPGEDLDPMGFPRNGALFGLSWDQSRETELLEYLGIAVSRDGWERYNLDILSRAIKEGEDYLQNAWRAAPGPGECWYPV